jgi:alkylation response protein AidB-like acyl-CoA dehydrogenase
MDAGSAEDQRAYVLMREGDRYRLATVPVKACGHATDLTRRIGEIAAGTEATIVPAAGRTLNAEDLAAVSALGLTLTTADLVGIMRGVTDLAVAYATERRQYGVAVGSFQSIQHLLAEAHCLTEGARSALLHAAWAVDALPPVEALAAGRIAKAFAARAARTVCETSIQVHGGMGNTWECMAHVYLRRALLSERWFGYAGEQLRQLGQTRLGAKHGLS